MNNTSINKEKIKDILEKYFPNSEIIINNLGNSDKNYIINIKSNLFNKKTKVDQHKMVYSILKQFIGNELHAVSIKTEKMGI